MANILVNIGWVNGLVPDGTKPLHEPMLTEDFWHASQSNFTENTQESFTDDPNRTSVVMVLTYLSRNILIPEITSTSHYMGPGLAHQCGCMCLCTKWHQAISRHSIDNKIPHFFSWVSYDVFLSVFGRKEYQDIKRLGCISNTNHLNMHYTTILV